MRRVAAAAAALLSLVLGVLVVRRDFGDRLRAAQLVLSEFSWLGMALGGAALLLGRRPGPGNPQPPAAGLRRLSSAATDTVAVGGLILSARPFAQQRATLGEIEHSLTRVLGPGYTRVVPQAVREQWSPATYSLANTLGAAARRAKARVWRDVLYAEPDGQPLSLDTYEPLVPPLPDSLRPAVIVLHPGGWHSGNKGQWFEPHNRVLAAQGYAVFDVQYRLTARATWPAQLQDVLTAVRWVRANAARYQVDPGRIILLGRSAGGQLALTAAEHAGPQEQVQGVIALYAPTKMIWPNLPPDSPIIQLLGGRYEDCPEAYVQSSPLLNVKPGLPPMLLMTGEFDGLVPHLHTLVMGQELLYAGNRAVTVVLPWARHGFDALLPGLGAQVAMYTIERFLGWAAYREGLQGGLNHAGNRP